MIYKNNNDYIDVIIIGNGIAGYSAATAIKLINNSHVLIVSEEDIPVYSPCVMGCYISEEVPLEQMLLKSRSDYITEGIDCAFGVKVDHIDLDNKNVFLNSEAVNYNKLIFATGSRPFMPPIEGSNKKGVFFLKTIYDAIKIKTYQAKRAVVVGSGPIGIEVAVALKSRGLDVTIIELLPRLLPKLLDKDAAKKVHNHLKDHGINILLKERVTAINGNPNVRAIFTESKEIPCEIVVMATGMKPRVDLAEMCNIQTGKLGGIIVNQFLETNHKGVFACGDCVETLGAFSKDNEPSLLWHNARRQGEIAGNNSIGTKKAYIGVTNIVAINAFGLFAGSIGYTASDLLSRNRKAEIFFIKQSKADLWLIEEGGALVGAQTVGEINYLGILWSSIMNRATSTQAINMLKKRGIIPTNTPISERVLNNP